MPSPLKRVFPQLLPELHRTTTNTVLKVRSIRRNHNVSSNASLTSIATNKSTFEHLTSSPFNPASQEKTLKHPMADIRRAMLLKKRQQRQGDASQFASLSASSSKPQTTTPKLTVLESATSKVLKKAKRYDRYKQGSVLQDCFADYSMESVEFRRTMQKALGVKLNSKEAKALLVAFDADGNGLLDGAEFLQLFFRTAHDEHSREFRVVQKKKRIQQIEEKEKRKKAILEEKKMNDSVVDFNFDPSDTKRVLRRLAKLASVYDILSENGKRANAQFQCELRPHQLKITIAKCFGLNLTAKELGALVTYFDKDGDGDVSGAEFLISFTKLGSIQQRLERKKRDAVIKRQRASGLLLPLVPTSLGR